MTWTGVGSTPRAWAQLSVQTDSFGGVDFVLKLNTHFPLRLANPGLPLYSTIESP